MIYTIKQHLTYCEETAIEKQYLLELTQHEAQELLQKVTVIAKGVNPVDARSYFFEKEGYMVGDITAIKYYINNKDYDGNN